MTEDASHEREGKKCAFLTAFVFDGRKILDHSALVELGYHVETIGKRVSRSPVNRTWN